MTTSCFKLRQAQLKTESFNALKSPVWIIWQVNRLLTGDSIMTGLKETSSAWSVVQNEDESRFTTQLNTWSYNWDSGTAVTEHSLFVNIWFYLCYTETQLASHLFHAEQSSVPTVEETGTRRLSFASILCFKMSTTYFVSPDEPPADGHWLLGLQWPHSSLILNSNKWFA